MPAGRVSVKPTPVSAVLELGFVIVKLSWAIWFRSIVVRLKLTVMTGGRGVAKIGTTAEAGETGEAKC
jgi:hypothetical protein